MLGDRLKTFIVTFNVNHFAFDRNSKQPAFKFTMFCQNFFYVISSGIKKSQFWFVNK